MGWDGDGMGVEWDGIRVRWGWEGRVVANFADTVTEKNHV